MGFLSLIAASTSSVLRRASQARHSPSSAFLTPSMVYSATGLVGLFRPTATSRVLPPGVFPHTQPDHLVDGLCPLVVGARTLPTVARQCHVLSPRPQGVAPGVDPLSVQR
jgi:hypothetical protein